MPYSAGQVRGKERTVFLSLRASSPVWDSETGLAVPRSRVLARLASLAQIGELARRLRFPYIRGGKSSYNIFSLVLYSARIMLGVKSVQFSLHQGRKVKLQHFLSRTLFGTHHVRSKERTVFLTSGEESQVTTFSLSYSIRHASC